MWLCLYLYLYLYLYVCMYIVIGKRRKEKVINNCLLLEMYVILSVNFKLIFFVEN